MKDRIKRWLNDWRLPATLVFFWAFSPFWPEPHIWGKIKWIIGGEAASMGWLDWFDFAWHLIPLTYLLYLLNKKIFGEG